MHAVVCYVVHSFHPQMAYATPSQIKKVLNFIATHRGTHTSGFDQKQNQKAVTQAYFFGFVLKTEPIQNSEFLKTQPKLP